MADVSGVAVCVGVRLVAVMSLLGAIGCGGGEQPDSETGLSGVGDGTPATGEESGDDPSTSGDPVASESAGSGGDADTSAPDDGGEGDTTSAPEADTGAATESGGPDGQNLLVNPSLEAWATAAEVNSFPDDWHDCGGGLLGLEAVPDACEAVPASAADGRRYARAFGDERIGQQVPTEPGETYSISMQHTAVEGCFGGAPDSGWEIVVDGAVLFTTPAGAGTQWATASVEFVATAATADVCFRKAGGAGGLDDLSFVRQ